MGAVAIINFRNDAGDTWVAKYPGTEEAINAAIVFAFVEYRCGGSNAHSLNKLHRFYDHSVANGAEEPGGEWFSITEGVNTFDEALAELRISNEPNVLVRWRDARVGRSPWETPSNQLRQALEQIYAALVTAADCNAREFKLVVYD